MTLDEAIQHAEEVAEEHTNYNRYGGFESCDECAKEHRQLANWLKELKQLREQEPCKDAVSRKAIEKLKRYRFSYDNSTTIPKSDLFVKLTDLRDLPSVTPERKKGHWIDYSEECFVECSECGSATNCDGNINELHFCFSCGAKMESEE